MIKNQVFESN